MKAESHFLNHCACDACGSSDGNSLYSDGHTYCHVCGAYKAGEGEPAEAPEPVAGKGGKPLIPPGEFKALLKRGISEETCRKWGYSVGEFKDQTVQIATYRDDQGRPIAQKVRFPNKDFTTRGDFKAVGLYGQHLWRDGGKRVVITEGEIDALTVSQLQGNKWPVVSVPNGAQGAAKSISKSIEWLERFEEVVLMFDQDEPGIEAAEECAAKLSPGKAKIAKLPLKDPNEMLQAGRGKEVVDAIWEAKEWRPDGIVTIDDLWDDLLVPVEMGLPWWLPPLTLATYGRRYGELYCFGAGTGVGKTDFLTQQIIYDLTTLKEPVGVFFLEQQPKESLLRLAGKFAGRRFHVPDDGWTPEELKDAAGALRRAGKLYLYDHFGVAEWDKIEGHIRFLNHSLGVRIFYVDHLTALADPSNERESLETIMGRLGGLVKELDIMVHLVSHLATPEGKPHEEGGRVMIRHFKGSRAIGFWSHFMFGLERDQQAEDPALRQTTTFRILKDRLTGQATGQTLFLGYEVASGRLFETAAPPKPARDHGFRSETDDDCPF